jgi:hypothetical protein
MNLFIRLLIFFWLCPLVGQSQELIWEKKIPLSNYEKFSCVVKSNDGGYFAFGTTDKWMLLNPVIGGAFIMKFDQNGDTLWTKWTGYFGGFNQVYKGENGTIFALLAYRDQVLNKTSWCIYTVSSEGEHLFNIPIQVEGASLLDMEFRHGYIWISGQKTPSLFHPPGFTYDFLLMKLRPDGTEVFSYVYNANDPTSRGRKMEFMPNGNILFSGSVGNKIGAFEIDTAGVQVQYRTYFTNPLNMGWQGTVVNQIADGNRIVGAYRSTNPVSHYLGKHDTSNIKIWGGIKPGAILQGSANADSSIIVITQSDVDEIKRIKSDSSIMWAVNFTNTPLGRTKQIWDVYYEQDQSGVIVGSNSNPGGSNANLYIAKFGGFGIPFDPTSVKAFESLKTDAVPIPFPNPGKDWIKFTILAGPGKVTLTDMQGRKVWEGEYLPEKGVNTKSLPTGIYNYRLERNGKVWSGKWVKE